MNRPSTVRFELERYRARPKCFENDLVARLPGLLITQFSVPAGESPGMGQDRLALRFDFIDDWYSVLAFLDRDKQPTGHYRICIQTPLQTPDENGAWLGNDLLLRLEVLPNQGYSITGEDDFFAAVEDGWMRVYAAAKAREAVRQLCCMLDEGCLPQEVMDAVCG